MAREEVPRVVILAQLSWHTTATLAWVLFGGWILFIEHSENNARYHGGLIKPSRYRRKKDWLWIGVGVWLFVIMLLLIY